MFVRDTAHVSVTDTEWPQVKDRLIARLGHQPSPASPAPQRRERQLALR
jgi:hypothetical protein